MPTRNIRQFSLFPNQIADHILPTNLTSVNHPVHRWFSFVAGFSPEFVAQCIYDAQLNQNNAILDPFAGCGTTLVEANLQGVPSVGFDVHPFLAEICRAKLVIEADTKLIIEIQQELSIIAPHEHTFASYSVSAQRFLRSLFSEDVLLTIVNACDQVSRYEGTKYVLAHLILSKVLDLVSHAKTDGIYKAPSSKKTATTYLEALNRVCDLVIEDLASCQSLSLRNKARIFIQSSEDMSPVEKRSIDMMITSPPYLNNFDFAEMTRMHLYFWKYAQSWGDITEKVRSKLIVNTTTALKGHKNKITTYRSATPLDVREELDHYQKVLAEKRSVKAGKKEYDFLVYPYFAQMTAVLTSAHRVLKHGAIAHIIVSDAALYGVHIRTHEILASIMRTIGYTEIEIKKLRSRGDRWVLEKREGTENGLGEYQITASVYQN